MGDDRSDLAEPMHRPDVDLGVRRVVPCRLEVRDHVAGGETCSATGVNVYPLWRRRGELAPVERGISTCDDRPCVRGSGRLAGEVPGFELRDGCVEVVEIERDPGRDPVVGVDLDYP